MRTGAGASVVREFGREVADAVAELAVRQRATAFTVVLSALAVTLGRFGGQDRFALGTVVDTAPERDQVGMFLDTVTLAVDLTGDPGFAELVGRVRDRAFAAYEHRSVPFDEVVRALNPARDPGATPLFQVMVEFENEASVDFAAPDLVATVLDVPSDRAPFDLSLYLTRHREGLRLIVEYATDLFDDDTVLRVVDQVEHVLRSATADPAAAVSRLGGAAPADLAAIDGWHRPAWPGELIPDLVLRQAEHTPDAIALLGDDVRVTYADLVMGADRIARRIAARGLGPGSVVAVLLPRGPELVTALLGVLLSGAAYLPIDHTTTPARARYLLEDSGAALLVASTVEDHGVPVIAVGDAEPGLPPVTALPEPDDTAYLIYTSGSSGRPKAVVVPHRGPANLVRWHLAQFGPLRTAQWTSVSFDVHVQEVFTTLAAGATLVIVDEEHRHDLAGVVQRHAVERVFLPYTPLKHLLDAEPALPSLREVFSAGEPLVLTPAVRRFFAEHPDCALYNQYGPTEASVIVTSTRVDPAGPDRPSIGSPIDGVRIGVIGPDGTPGPVGAVGEIHIGGVAVAKGYLGRDDVAFGRTGYHTGDLGRWRPDGTVEFLGRRDDQVKVRGHRVEPGEAQAAICRAPGVVDAAVVARPDAHGDTELVAYVVGAETGTRAHVELELPAYLVPGKWVWLDRLPHTVNGKLDRAALPDPDQHTGGRAPKTEWERRVHDAWRRELGLSSVDTTTSFFAVGGHSLSAIRVVNRLPNDHGARLSMSEFFRAPTIRAIAACLDPGHAAAEPTVVDTAPSPSVLRRLWRRHHERANPEVYNVAHRVDVDGELDPDALVQAFRDLAARHAALRLRVGPTTFDVLDAVAVTVAEPDGSDMDTWVRAVADRPFPLDAAPLFRLGIARTADRNWTVVVVLHHAVCDAWSLTTLWSELGSLYAGGELPVPKTQYTDVARWERQLLTSPRRTELESFWRDALAGLDPRMPLPTDRPRPATLSGRGALHQVTVEVGDRVTAIAERLGVTPYLVLLSRFAQWLGAESGRVDVVVAASSANRLRPELEDVVGLLGDAVLVPARGVADALSTLAPRIGDAFYRSLDHQALPLTEVVELVDPDLAAAHVPQLLFTVVTVPPASLSLPDAQCAVTPMTRSGVARTELYTVLQPADGKIDITMEYSTDLFDESTIRRWADGLAAMLLRED